MKMVRTIAHLIGALFRWRKRLVARFVVTSIGRAMTSMAVIFFIREFLASAVEERTGFASTVAGSLEPSAVLWLSAGLLLVTYVCGALLYYDNQIVVQRIIKVIELGVMERVIRHLFKLSENSGTRDSLDMKRTAVPEGDRRSGGIQRIQTCELTN